MILGTRRIFKSGGSSRIEKGNPLEMTACDRCIMPQTAKNSGITEVIWLFSQIAESSAAQNFRGGRNVDR
jgi:hypothetical protein